MQLPVWFLAPNSSDRARPSLKSDEEAKPPCVSRTRRWSSSEYHGFNYPVHGKLVHNSKGLSSSKRGQSSSAG